MARRRPHPRTRLASPPVLQPALPHDPWPEPRPVCNVDQATGLVELSMSETLASETLCFILDMYYRPVTCIVIEGGQEADAVLGIADLLTQVVLDYPIVRVFIVSCRPGRGFESDDLHRWFGLDHLLQEGGVDLLEWFVRDERTMVAVSALAGEPSRWPHWTF